MTNERKMRAGSPSPEAVAAASWIMDTCFDGWWNSYTWKVEMRDAIAHVLDTWENAKPEEAAKIAFDFLMPNSRGEAIIAAILAVKAPKKEHRS
jgi:hypothetical protein